MASNTVNRPTNVAQKAADINQKLQLYGIYNGMFNHLIASFVALAELSGVIFFT